MRAAIRYAIANDRKSVTIVQGQHREVHRGRVPRLGLQARRTSSDAERIDGGPWCGEFGTPTPAADRHRRSRTDAFLQQIPAAPGRIRRDRHHQPGTATTSPMRWRPRSAASASPRAPTSRPVRLFRSHHGTAPKYAGLDKVNPGSLILPGRNDAAPSRLGRGRQPGHQVDGSRHRRQTGDLRLRPPDGGASELSCSEFRRRHDCAHVGCRRRPKAPAGRGLCFLRSI